MGAGNTVLTCAAGAFSGTAIAHSSAVLSRAQVGMEAPVVTVETHLSGGLPGFTLVGLPATAVREARDRVRSALASCGFRFPKGRVVVNLAPGDLTKEGPRYDLAIAASILRATGQVPGTHLQRLELVGELSLDGTLRDVRGALCAALALRQTDPRRQMVLPARNAQAAAMLGESGLLALSHLSALPALLADPGAFALDSGQCNAPSAANTPRSNFAIDNILGAQAAKRALLIAASGGHHLLLVGPPGTGKTLLARALAELLPDLQGQERVEVAAIYSAAGLPDPGSTPPVREPHHSSSATALVGGGSSPRPGEISLAHRGILFLDELPHFNSNVLNLLREPMGARSITIARTRYRTRFPAGFQLVAAMNPCPSGLTCESGRCRCSPTRARAYQARISGPLLDRIDLQVPVPSVPQDLLLAQVAGATPSTSRGNSFRDAVADARARQQARQGGLNAELSRPPSANDLTPEAARLLAEIARQKPLSARAFHRLLKVARTVADLAGQDQIDTEAVAEAFGYRQLDWENGLGLPGL